LIAASTPAEEDAVAASVAAAGLAFAPSGFFLLWVLAPMIFLRLYFRFVCSIPAPESPLFREILNLALNEKFYVNKIDFALECVFD
jgi:hypothetical protein